MSTATQTTARDELLALLASAPDDVIERHASILRDALGCPTWCVEDHDNADEIGSLSSHQSEDVQVNHDQGNSHRVRLVVEYRGVMGDGVVRVGIDDNLYTSEQARALAAVLEEHADRINGGSAAE